MVRKTTLFVLFGVLVILAFVLLREDSHDARPTNGQYLGRTDTRAAENPSNENREERIEEKDVSSAPRKVASNKTDLEVRLVDLVDSPIPDGRIEVEGMSYESENSEFLIRNVTEEILTIKASAHGFQDTTTTVELPVDHVVAIPMEYLCDFGISVKDAGENPVEGARVQVFPGPAVPRPVSESVVLDLASEKYRWDFRGRLVLARTGDGIKVVDTTGLQDPQSSGRPGTYLERGDLVIGLEPLPRCMRECVGNLSVLRFWDSLAALSSQSSEKAPAAILHFQQGSQTKSALISAPDPVPKDATIAEKVTDASGQCFFSTLPPRVYYIQASLEGARSAVYVINPMDRMVHIGPLHTHGSVSVVVHFNTPRIRALDRWIGDAEVRLHGSDQRSFFEGHTDNKGSIDFNRVPWGKYNLRIIPPADIGAVPSSKDLELAVDAPEETIDVYFDLHSGVSVSGIVVRQDTREPVPRYPMKMTINRYNIGEKERRTPRMHWLDYALTRSDMEGNFEFVHVPEGEFSIEGLPPSKQKSGYLATEASLHIARKGEDVPRPAIRFMVGDEDVTGLVFVVVPASETVLEGEVVYENGAPVSGAEVTVDGVSEHYLQSGGHSREDGRFTLELALPDQKNPYETIARAIVMNPPFEQVSFDQNGQPQKSYDYESGIAAEGTAPVKFCVGDAVKNIQIIVKEEDPDHVLVGTLRTSDGRIPDSVQACRIGAYQEHEEYPADERGRKQRMHTARLEPDGSYRIERMKPGPFLLFVEGMHPGASLENPQRSFGTSYMDEHFQLEMLVEPRTMTHDIILREASYIHGRVLGEDLKPLGRIVVLASSETDSDSAADMTNEDGMLLIHVPKEKTYTLEVLARNRDEKYVPKLEHLSPPVENLVFQVKLQKAETAPGQE
ncbi:MAG: hypothetical protein ABIH23_29900 [bacterium]